MTYLDSSAAITAKVSRVTLQSRYCVSLSIF